MSTAHTKRKSDPPAIGLPASAQAEQEQPPAEPAAVAPENEQATSDADTPSTEAELTGPAAIAVSMPLADTIGHGWQSNPSSARHVDCQCQSMEQRRALMALRAGLDAAHARTANGRPVTSYADAIRWLLEEVAKTQLCRDLIEGQA